jgi:hypothetical protein
VESSETVANVTEGRFHDLEIEQNKFEGDLQKIKQNHSEIIPVNSMCGSEDLCGSGVEEGIPTSFRSDAAD